MQAKSAGLAHKPCGPSLFVSHASKDQRVAWEFVREMRRGGVESWFAPRDLTAGKRYGDEIVAAIDCCDAFLLIFSEYCNQSPWVPREIALADDAGKTIIVVRIDNAPAKGVLKLYLANLQQIDARGKRDKAIREVLRGLNRDRACASPCDSRSKCASSTPPLESSSGCRCTA